VHPAVELGLRRRRERDLADTGDLRGTTFMTTLDG
jgi:hypothetical protein